MKVGDRSVSKVTTSAEFRSNDTFSPVFESTPSYGPRTPVTNGYRVRNVDGSLAITQHCDPARVMAGGNSKAIPPARAWPSSRDELVPGLQI